MFPLVLFSTLYILWDYIISQKVLILRSSLYLLLLYLLALMYKNETRLKHYVTTSLFFSH